MTRSPQAPAASRATSNQVAREFGLMVLRLKVGRLATTTTRSLPSSSRGEAIGRRPGSACSGLFPNIPSKGFKRRYPSIARCSVTTRSRVAITQHPAWKRSFNTPSLAPNLWVRRNRRSPWRHRLRLPWRSTTSSFACALRALRRTPALCLARGSTKAPAALRTADSSIVAPMHGIVAEIKVKVGDDISSGQVVAVVEAMKMMNEVIAHRPGKVVAVNAKTGETIESGSSIISLSDL